MGEVARVSVKAQGDGLTYEWYLKNAGSDEWIKSSLTGKTSSCTMNTARDGREVYCVITDAYGNQVTSASAKITGSIIQDPPSTIF